MTCSLCRGRKHVAAKDGSWRRCRCIEARIQAIRYNDAGVPPILHRKKMEALYERSHFAGTPHPGSLAPPIPHTRVYWIRGEKIDSARLCTTAWLLREALRHKAVGRRVSIANLIDAQFRDDGHAERDHLLGRIRDADALVVDVDVDNQHKRLASTLIDVFAIRSTQPGVTVFASFDDIASMPDKYGDELAKRFRSKGVVSLRRPT